MSDTLSHCPNCGTAWPDGADLCPHCGFVRPSMPVWPPPPEGFIPPALPAPPRTLTGRAWTDFALGAAVQYLTHLATAQALVRFTGLLAPSQDGVANYFAPSVLDMFEAFGAVVFGLGFYYGLRRFYPILARGSGWMTIVLLAVLLGAFFTCRPLRY